MNNIPTPPPCGASLIEVRWRHRFDKGQITSKRERVKFGKKIQKVKKKNRNFKISKPFILKIKRSNGPFSLTYCAKVFHSGTVNSVMFGYPLVEN